MCCVSGTDCWTSPLTEKNNYLCCRTDGVRSSGLCYVGYHDSFQTFPCLKIYGLTLHLSNSTRFLERLLAPALETSQSNTSSKSGLAYVKGRVQCHDPERLNENRENPWLLFLILDKICHRDCNFPHIHKYSSEPVYTLVKLAQIWGETRGK